MQAGQLQWEKALLGHQCIKKGDLKMRSILIKDTTREERIRIVHQALWGACGIDCEFCSGCDNRGGGRTE